MKRFFLLCVCSLLLCSCHFSVNLFNGEPSPLTGQTVITTQTLDQTETSAEIVVRTQYPVYGDDCVEISLYIENFSSENVEYGAEWILEKRSGDEWRKMKFIDDLAWVQPLYTLAPGGVDIANCSLEIFKYKLTDGEYRIVKELNGVWRAAEFTIGASPITAEAPHGFTPLEKLPADYSAEQAARDGVVVFTGDDVLNAEKITEFFRYANLRSFRGQLRIARFTTEGDMILTDVVRKTADRIDCYSDTTRDAFGTRTIDVAYYSYFTTDGNELYVSNYSSHKPYSDRELFPLEKTSPEVLQFVEEYYANPYGGYSAVAAYSPNGESKAESAGGAEFFLQTSGWGTTQAIRAENQENGMNIVDLVWQSDDVCVIIAEKTDGSYYYEFIKVNPESMKDVQSLYCATSASPYQIQSGKLVIPE